MIAAAARSADRLGRWTGAVLAIAMLCVMTALPTAAHASACTPPVTNHVACENTLPGVPESSWQVGAGDPTIQGFATQMSVNVGQAVSFKISSATSHYHVDILRLGYYAGDGARMIAANLVPTATPTQPACLTDSSTGLIDCGNWSVSLTWTVPSTAVSGVFIARLARNDTGGASIVPFVVRNDASHSDVVLQTSDATWAAYDNYGGNSLYQCTVACPPGNPRGYKGAFAVSYNKPFTTAGIEGPVLFYAEYPMIRFLEANGYDVSYLSSVDVNSRASLLLNHSLFISSGHDEYWSNTQRNNVQAARDAGVNLAFFGGNDIFWKTRWGPSIDGTNTANRTLVAYKDTHFDAPTDPVEWTGTWRDPRFSPPGDGGRPENALMGQMFVVNTGTTSVTVPTQYKQLREWRNTSVATLGAGQSLSLAPDSLGYEWDADFDNKFRPPGTFDLSSTTVTAPDVFVDYGSTTAQRTITHHITLYRAPSGARVFSVGTVDWSRGLDNDSNPDVPTDHNMQQITVNVFGDMGAQPLTPIPGIVPATASPDNTPPSSSITSPGPGTLADGTAITISGSATEAGGGVVAGVEVSTDGGTTWHPANGTSTWTYPWTVTGYPSTTILSRAVDDSGNLETPSAGVKVSVSCSCSMWGNLTPPTPDSGDPNSVELGVKFTSDTFGAIAGIRFYKYAANTGTHIGSLWTTSGQRLAQATFTSESGTGWQAVTFASPVVVTQNTTYVASYFAPSGHYAATPDYMYPPPAPTPTSVGSVNSPPLHAILNTGGATTGVYAYASSSTFPTSSVAATNYWVDVMFSPAPAPGQATSPTASAIPGGADVSWTAASTGGPTTTYTVTPYIGTQAQTPTTVIAPSTSARVSSLTPGTAYTFTVQASNPNGSGPTSAASNSVVPLARTSPGAPTGVTAQAISASAIAITWVAPTSDGGTPVTGYTVTPYVGSSPQAPVPVSPPATSVTVSGLTSGTQYTFIVTATNSIGAGAQSAPSASAAPYNTIFGLSTPPVADAGDSNSVELGVRFQADVAGTVYGVRFYKAPANVGTHVGNLWTTAGQRLASATFANESPSGWQIATFSTPVSVSAHTTYVVSYLAPSGHYAVTAAGFASSGADNAPLHSPASVPNAGNGVYAYGASSSYPSNSFNSTNYWVDADFVVLPPPGQVIGANATAGQTSADVTWNAPPTGGAPSSYVVTPYIGSSAQPPTIVTGAPPATGATVRNLTAAVMYTFAVQAVNANGSGNQSAPSNAVTPTPASVPLAPQNVTAQAATQSAAVSWTPPTSDGGQDITAYVVTPYVGGAAQAPTTVAGSTTAVTVTGLADGVAYSFKVAATNSVGSGAQSTGATPVTPFDMLLDLSTPAVVNAMDTNSVELGVKFTVTAAGSVYGIRFYKSAANTGAHLGSLWSATGQRLAQATFTNESASGWQTVMFSSPVQVAPNTTYVASYFAPNGGYSLTASQFASAGLSNGHLIAPSSPSGGGNGVYVYNLTSAFPTLSFNSSNYWVDALFVPLAQPGAVASVSATPDYGSADVAWSAPASGGAVTTYAITPYIGSAAQSPVVVSGNPAPTSTTVSGLSPSSTYTFTVTASNASGTAPASPTSNAVAPLPVTHPSGPTGVSALPAAAQSASVSWTAPAQNGGAQITGYTITPYLASVAQAPVAVGAATTTAAVTGLRPGMTYTFTVNATNSVGTGPQSAASSPVTLPLATIFGLGVPVTVDAGDSSSVELGVVFTSDDPGFVDGIRFYKAAANTGTHFGSLWTSSGQRLAEAQFSGETATGWQTAIFATPVAISANTTYVASYFAPSGHYSATGGTFASAGVDSPPLHALPNTSGANGIYGYASTSSFPTSSFNATNYWVDVLFGGPGS